MRRPRLLGASQACPWPLRAWTGALAVVLVAGGCSTPADRVLEPVVRLTEHEVEPTLAGAPERCAIGDEFRPAIGCPIVVLLPRVETVVGEDGSAAVSIDLPRSLRERSLVLSPLARVVGKTDWQSEPAVILERAPRVTRVELSLDPKLRGKRIHVRASVRTLPPVRRELRTGPIEIDPGALLRVSPGLLVVAPPSTRRPTEFSVHAEFDGARRELLRLSLAPGAEAEWHEQQVSLEALAGKSVRFVFLSSTAVPPGASTALDFPLWGSPQILAPRPRGKRRNVLLVSLDTVRWDHVNEAWGSVRVTPRLDRIASEGTRFRQAVAPYNATSASHMTLFTGIYPVVHKVTHPAHLLAAEVPTLTEVLARAGYETAAFTENAMISAGSGFARGFDLYHENRGALRLAGSSAQTIGKGSEWLERNAREVFFLFLHTYEAHAPYVPSAEQLEAFPEPSPEEREAGRWQQARRKYAAEVRVVDNVLERLFERMQELGVLDDTIVVITADHGEEFGEHGALGHAKTLYDEVLRVPLVLRAPGLVPAGGSVDEQVSLVDVVPTILELLGLEPPSEMHGQSLVGAMQGEGTLDPVRFAEGLSGDAARTRLVVARRRDRKWIWRDDQPEHALVYNLDADPKEQNPLDDAALQAEGKALRDRYQALAGGRSRGAQHGERPIDPETARKLEALGYVD